MSPLTKKIAIPKWFNLTNYSELNNLSLKQVYSELTVRINMISQLYDEYESINIFPISKKWKNIIAGTPISESAITQSLNTPTAIASQLTNVDIEMCYETLQMAMEEPKFIIANTSFFKDKYTRELCSDCLDILKNNVNEEHSWKHNEKQESLFTKYSDKHPNVTFEEFKSLYELIYDNPEIEYEECIPLSLLCDTCQTLSLKQKIAEPYPNPIIPDRSFNNEEFTVDYSHSDTLGYSLLKFYPQFHTATEILAAIKPMVESICKKHISTQISSTKLEQNKSFVKGIFDYQIIPYLDLYLWRVYFSAKESVLISDTSVKNNDEPISLLLGDEFDEKHLPKYKIDDLNIALNSGERDLGNHFKTKILPKYLSIKNVTASSLELKENDLDNYRFEDYLSLA
ncbi:hypothetical protein GCM10008107_16380 [Psychrosphaera saromensis]|uniref:Uncharacterized protein n=1 Tax=Psychrosphaera saromensis TaxID=716813 RepID=A0A2S7UTT9_9GAMM|nr:DUF6387 family protein [Psychrosphaera saromensis]PQJ53149.1 hypothetical protein BTO11_05375 [Psychrosphaera saromensis]GHB67657.1 hypothetical protein GCM10008107_16380 [Psychrosphaera saromensis]GLQ15094.1 hypothetical protein GCM10007917_25490 [Psychrosphaera saromensis]